MPYLVIGLVIAVSGCQDPPPPVEIALLDRSLCQRGPTALEEGTWHMDIQFDGLEGFPSVLRMKSDTLWNGRTTATKKDKIYGQIFQLAYKLRSGREAQWVWNACASPSPGKVVGPIQECFDGKDCRVGRFEAVRLQRMAGEGESQGLSVVGQFGDFIGQQPGAVTTNVRVRGNYAYLSRTTDGLAILDITDPKAPAPVARVKPRDTSLFENWNDVKLYKNYALMASSRAGMVVIDVTEPKAPQIIGNFPKSDKPVGVHTLFVEGDRAYLADTTLGGLRVFDLSDPVMPKEVGTFVHNSVQNPAVGAYLHDLEIENGIAYLHYWGGGFVVVDTRVTPFKQIGHATYPRMTSHAGVIINTGGRKYALHGDEDYTAHLRVYDVTRPDDSKWMSKVGELSLRPEISIHNMIAVGTRAYIAWYQDGARIVDIAGDGAPKASGYYNSWSADLHPGVSFYEGAIGVDVDPARKHVYVADTARGLIILNDPLMPAQ